MGLFLAISQGSGTSLATGVRPFLVPLLVGGLARADAGVDFDGTEYAFLESIGWLALMLALSVGAWWIDRSRIPVSPATWAVAAAALGAVLFAGSLAEEDYSSAAGLPAGAVLAALGFVAARVFLGGAGERLASRGEASAGTTLSVLATISTLAFATLVLFVPPVAYVALAFCAWVLLAQRRRSGTKYEGLRILR